MTETQRSLLALHLSVLIFGGTGLFSKFISLPAIDITAFRSIVAALVLFLILGAKRTVWQLASKKDALLMLFMGLLMAGHWITYFHSMQVSTVAIGMLALYTYPVITVFLEPLFNRQQIVKQDIISALIVFAGIGFIVPELSFDNSTSLGVAWGILSALLFALRNVMVKRYISHYSGRQSMMMQTLVVALAVLPFTEHSLFQLSHEHWWLLLVLGSLFTAAPHALYTSSLSQLKAKTAALVGCLQPVYGIILAYLLLAEQPTYWTLLGGLMILMAAVYETRTGHRKQS